MAVFDTPHPITATIAITAGDIRVEASERGDTVVEVRPTDAGNDLDVKAARQVRVDYTRGRLAVKEPTGPGRRFATPHGGGSVDVRIALPEDSHVRGGSAWAALCADGRLGEVRFEGVRSDIRLEHTGALRAVTVGGNVWVGRVVGHAEITTSFGDIRVGVIEGSAVIGNESGDTTIDEIIGDLRVGSTRGGVDIARAHADVEVKGAHGDVRIGEAGRGRIRLTTVSGAIAVGVREGSTAGFDVSTVSGRMRNLLDPVHGPGRAGEVVEIRARTFDGDVTISRSRAPLGRRGD
ncbi:DUF4097 family beta strand repeat-containing protein [Embleya sp. MST-111070]|uniref:DUF4097 family beta strand repeat-containing protein n=1 Tax=Embleya sp. MST-111070 TaxID=3398231 RepID=UPI003F73FB46